MSIPDQAARDAATDPSKSVLLTAPAGSGKTGVLLLRYLKCLLTVTEPEQVVAITFTKKAAAEIRERVVEALQAAKEGHAVSEYQAEVRGAAQRVLAQDAKFNWGLLQNPSRMRISTFDVLCGQVVRRLPLLSGLAQNTPTDMPDALYREACLSLFRELENEHADAELRAALGRALAYANNRIETLIPLLGNLLHKRDQWVEGIFQYDIALMSRVLEDYVRGQYSSIVNRLRDRHELDRAVSIFSDQSTQGEDFAWASDFAPGATESNYSKYRQLAERLITADRKSLRKAGGVNVKMGFPPKQAATVDLKALLSDWWEGGEAAEIHQDLLSLVLLPPQEVPSISAELVSDLLVILRSLLAHLRLVFERRGVVDFIEIAFRAITALSPIEENAGIYGDALLVEDRIQHIMIDEMQDTSINQIAFMTNLTHDWSQGDGRSMFLCGDLQQSIYLFRGALVDKFQELISKKCFNHIPLEVLALQCNFRSSPQIVNWVNAAFCPLVPETFIEAAPQVEAPGSVIIHPTVGGNADTARETEARQVVDVIQRELAAHPEDTVTILVRGRNDLKAIIPALKQAEIAFAAQDIYKLDEIPAVSDFLALARAWWHGADRASWVGLLRAPFVGLSWDDCLTVCASAKSNIRDAVVTGLHDSELSEDGVRRIERLRHAWEAIRRHPRCVDVRWATSALWHSLGGPAACDSSDLNNVQRAMQLIASHSQGGTLTSITDFDAALEKAYAVSNPAPVELMTVHKSKGLEFDTVILPGLGNPPPPGDSLLFYWRQLNGQFVIAPKTPSGLTSDAALENDNLYDHMRTRHTQDENDEMNRHLYVALTRAKRRLHLMGNAAIDGKGNIKPRSNSMLERLWPQVESEFSADVCLQDTEESDQLITPTRAVFETDPDFSVSAAYTTPATEPDVLEILAKQAGLSVIDDNIEDRTVGIVYHELMRYAGVNGKHVLEDDIRVAKVISARLRHHCHPEAGLESSVGRTLSLLKNTLGCTIGQWILSGYQQSGSEQPIRQALGGRWEKLIIDRFFVDGDTCWIIDYKSAQGDSDAFFEMQKARYEEKMREYKGVIEQTGITEDVRCGLYFPSSRRLIECAT